MPGYLNRAGWLAYRRDGLTFTKRWTPQPDRPHVDFCGNAEVCTSGNPIELETLGPLVRLWPGECVSTWSSGRWNLAL